jgi:uncharacterized alpha-E superfamily protein
MLSRIAESLYWIGRLVERAEDTARLLDVHMSLLLEDVAIDETKMCTDVLTALGGVQPAAAGMRTAELLETLAYAADGPITGALSGARDNARTAREAISSEMWEALNTTRNSLPTYRARARKQGPHEFFIFVKMRAALVSGLADSTMSRDDGWFFLTLGRSLERVDMTVRILSVAGASRDPHLASVALLRACGAFEAYLRTYRALMATQQAAEFLLLDRLFPRSVFHALTEAEHALAQLVPAGVRRTGVADAALLALGRARTRLEFASSGTILADMGAHLRGVQQATFEASAAIADRFFDQQAVIAWSFEA